MCLNFGYCLKCMKRHPDIAPLVDSAKSVAKVTIYTLYSLERCFKYVPFIESKISSANRFLMQISAK